MQRLSQHAPTQHPTSEELSIGQIRFKAFDLGGHRIARRVWRDYYAKVYWLHVSKALEHQLPSLITRPAASFSFTHICIHPPCLQVDAVVYMVDAADGTRFGESKAELGALLSDDALAGVPFLVLGNKIDIPPSRRRHLSMRLPTTSGSPAAPPARAPWTSPAPECGPSRSSCAASYVKWATAKGSRGFGSRAYKV